MKKENLRRIKEKIESQMVNLNEIKKSNDDENHSIDRKIESLKEIKNNKTRITERREEIIDNCENALVSFLKEEEENKKLLTKLNSRENIFNSGAKFFKIGKEKLRFHDHDKMNEWHEAEEGYLRSNRRLHELHIKLIEAEECL